MGSESFLARIQRELGVRGRGRTVADVGDLYVLGETRGVYDVLFGGENGALTLDNAYLWNLNGA